MTRIVTDRGALTKERILRTAAELFARHGYHATGVSLLSDAVGLGRGALYYHIGSKEQLLYDISKYQVDALIESSRPIVSAEISPELKIRALARNLIENIAEHNSEWAVFFREMSALSAPYRDNIQTARETYESLWEQVLDEGFRRGDFRQVTSVARKGILGMFNYSYLWLRPDGSLSPSQVADQLVETVLHGIAQLRTA